MERKNPEVIKSLEVGGTLMKATYRPWRQRKNGEEGEVRHAIVDAWWYAPEGIPHNGSWHVMAEGIEPWPDWFVILCRNLDVSPMWGLFLGPKKFPAPEGARKIPCASRGAAAIQPMPACPHCDAKYIPDPTTGIPVHADEGFGTTMVG